MARSPSADNERRPRERASSGVPAGENQNDATNLAEQFCSFQLESIPEPLRNTPCWVNWSLKPGAKSGDKPTKVPIDPHTGSAASVTDPRTWGTIEQAVAFHDRLPDRGIGLVLTVEAGLIAVDLDHCVDTSTGVIAEWAIKIVQRLASYTELSPSGTGLHIFVRGALPPGRRRKGAFEVYDSLRFMTVTGRLLGGSSMIVEERTDIVRQLHAEIFGPQPAGKNRPRSTHAPIADDDELIQRASQAKNGDKFKALWEGTHASYSSPSEADLALCGLLAFWCGPDPVRIDKLFRRSGLMRDKWDERRVESTYGADTIARALIGKSEFYRPGKQKQPKSDASLRCTDTANAERFVTLAKGDLAYCAPQTKWYVWDGKHWLIDELNSALRLGKDVCRAIEEEAARDRSQQGKEELLEWRVATAGAYHRKSLVDLAKSEANIAVAPGVFNRDPWLLNCDNGTLHLRSGLLRPHSRADFITKVTPVAYVSNAACPRWEEFLARVLPDEAVRGFLQRFVGYSLTGDQGEQVFVILFGEGANGKSTFLRALQESIGSGYIIQCTADLLASRRERGHPTEQADLFGVRMAVCTELGEDRHLDEELVKRLTGGDVVRARRMREDFWEFLPTHHIVIAANHKPLIRGSDYAIWRRVLLVPFQVTIPESERDPALLEKLLGEREGILTWAVRGCQSWRANGLCAPEVVRAESQRYRDEMDVVRRFVEERCVRISRAETSASALHTAYLTWAREQSLEPYAQARFGRDLGRLGLASRKSHGVILYSGLRLRTGGDDKTSSGEGWGVVSA